MTTQRRETPEAKAIRDAFEEGFALSKFGGYLDTAWARSESRESAAASASVIAPEKEWKAIACLFHDALVGKGMAGATNFALQEEAVTRFDVQRIKDGDLAVEDALDTSAVAYRASASVIAEMREVLDECIVEGSSPPMRACAECGWEWHMDDPANGPDHEPQCIIKRLSGLLSRLQQGEK